MLNRSGLILGALAVLAFSGVSLASDDVTQKSDEEVVRVEVKFANNNKTSVVFDEGSGHRAGVTKVDIQENGDGEFTCCAETEQQDRCNTVLCAKGQAICCSPKTGKVECRRPGADCK